MTDINHALSSDLTLSSRGDLEAYTRLFERYSDKLNNFIYYLTYSREESEDITSEAFLKVYEAIQFQLCTGSSL